VYAFAFDEKYNLSLQTCYSGFEKNHINHICQV